MKKENQTKTKERVLALIDSEFESDAAFERAMGLAEKTVNNWRRERSASYMKMLPELAEKFDVTVTDLLDIPQKKEGDELSEEERELLTMYKSTRTLSAEKREALRKTLASVISLYVETADKD